MEAPSKRMRLTVVVEALSEENAHGDYRHMALAAFKERRFAMAVKLDDTFETVWSDIEKRYKTNYLDAQQAATFSIKKLQDSYECDLDMTDTVGDIFEGESDVRMRMIKVVPHFIYRETSVVPGSMLRPNGAQKRGGDNIVDGANKRRRIASQQRQDTSRAREISPNQPLPSIESQQAAAAGLEYAQAGRRMARSKTDASLVEVSRTETGQAPFSATAIRQEDPVTEQSLLVNGVDAVSPDELTGANLEPITEERPYDERPSPNRTCTPHEASQKTLMLPLGAEVAGQQMEATEDELADARERVEPLQPDSNEAAIHMSPLSSIEPEPTSAPTMIPRKDVYQVSSSPEFMHQTTTPGKPGRRYGRSPDSGSHLTHMAGAASQRDVNGDAHLTTSLLGEAAASTPANPCTPAHARPAKPGSLKKPSRASLVNTPASTKHSASSLASAMPALVASASQPRFAFQPFPVQMTPRKSSTQRASSTREETSTSLAAPQSVARTSKGKPAISTKQAPRTLTPKSTRSVEGSSHEKPFKCLTCNASFSRVDNLNRHTTSHSNEQAHACVICGRQFLRADALARHSRSQDVCTASQSSFDFDGKERDRDHRQRGSQGASGQKHPNKITSYLDTNIEDDAKRGTIPLLPNRRHSLCSKSTASSLSTGDHGISKSSPATAKIFAKAGAATPKSIAMSNGKTAKQPAITTSTAPPSNGIMGTVSATLSSSDPDHEAEPQRSTSMKSAHKAQGNPAKSLSQRNLGDNSDANDGGPELSKTLAEQKQLASDSAEPQTQDKPPSGQEAPEAARWGTQSWGFERLDEETVSNAKPKQIRTPRSSDAIILPVTEDEGFVEQDLDRISADENGVGSRSASVVASARSSPTESRRPARFLSHSPTPDASESDDDNDEATAVKITSQQANNKGHSESESDSSSDSSDDEDVETFHPPTGPTTDADAQAEPPSSPPLASLTTSTRVVSKSNQSTPSQARNPTQRTSIPLPTRQSPQALRSSQSVSVQAADRRRYTGFRSLREQLAETKSSQATTQQKTFDPRTVSLTKLAKSSQLAGLDGDDESSDDDSSSSSSSSESD